MAYEDQPRYVISVAATLAGMHPQTLRQYDRLGIVSPRRAAGRGRRYSVRDVERLRNVQRLSQEEGINLAGIKRILDLEATVERLEAERVILLSHLSGSHRVFSADARGEIIAMRRGERPRRGRAVARIEDRGAVVLWRPR